MSITAAITGITALVSELVEDPDKRAELTVRMTESLLKTSTTPKVDAFVKILIAFRDILVPLLRPLGSAAMTAFGVYSHYKGIEIDASLHALFDSAFPGWMTSRHFNKNAEQETRRKQAEYNWEDE